MSLFLITFLSLYSGMHAYAFIRLRGAFSPGPLPMALLAGLMGLLTIAPLLVRWSEGAGLERTAPLIAWPAYIWMGSIFILCSFLAALDILRAVAWLTHRFSGTTIPGFLTAAITCEIALLLALLASGYAIYEARRIRTDHVTVTTAKLPAHVKKIRVVQISDVHIGLLFRESRLESVLRSVRAAQPDILVSTGDLVDGRLSREDVVSRLSRMAAMIAAVPTKAGKFAVAGNHEFYAGIGPSLDFTRAAGFTVLRNQSIQLPEGITISGIDDLRGDGKGGTSASAAELELLKNIPADRFHLLLKHRPVVPVSSDGKFDLQLSGHVHKGQIFPFNLLVRMQFPIPCGTTLTSSNSQIHVSRGTGTWGPPMRLLAPPEITIIDIMPSS
jgi:predicted MPP superfamily phosphohydrolase